MPSPNDDLLTATPDALRALLASTSEGKLEDLLRKADAALANRILEVADAEILQRLCSDVPLEVLQATMADSSDEAIAKALRRFQPHQISTLLHDSPDSFIKRLIDVSPTSQLRDTMVKSLPISLQEHWLTYAQEIDAASNAAHRDLASAEISLVEERRRMVAELDETIRTKHAALRAQDEQARIKQDMQEQRLSAASKQLQTLQSEIKERQTQISEQEEELKARVAEFEEASRRQVQQRIEAKVPEFVAAAIKELEERENQYRSKASMWSIHGTAVLTIAILAATAISLFGTGIGGSIDTLPWQTLLFVSFKGLVVLGVLGLWAKHAFTVSNAYMHEAIKRSDRVHAISFGKLYLEIYGNNVERKELVEIFENWNIASESAFAKANPSGFEPQILDKISDLFRASQEKK